MLTKEIPISDEGKIPEVAKKLLQTLGNRKKIAFYGQIGAGKTTLIKEICRQIGVREQVCSPTYGIINQYSYAEPATEKGRLIHHVDLYRLNTLEEALDIGIEDSLYDDDFCFIEWPDLIESILPEEFIQIKIEILENSGRKIIFL